MTVLIVGVLYGLVFAYFATQNTFPITIRFGNFAFYNVPVYVIALGSLLLGVLISWIISLIDSVSSSFSLWNKDHALRETNRTVEDLQNRIHELEVENVRLRSEYAAPEVRQEHVIEEEHRPKMSLFERIRHNLSI